MYALRSTLLLAACALIMLPGCSGDTVSPVNYAYPPGSAFTASIASIGPSDIVLAIDVSDSISADELQSVVSALSGCLSDSDLIPQDGTMSVAALVYGDTVGAAIAGLTPVTATTLQDSIIPSLEGLLSDRIVGGGGADLATALEQAGDLLAASSLQDRHVLIAGSGAADDATAAGDACDALGAAGVMVSALAVNPDAAGDALLADCAADGFYSTDGSCSGALAWMLRVDLDLTPETAELDRNVDHTVTATVFRAGDADMYPEEGLDVSFMVISGPNASESATVATDTAGVAEFTYNGDGGPGTDLVVAEVMHPGTGNALRDTVEVTWVNAPPACDAGGPYEAIVESDTVYVTLDASGSSDADGDTLMYSWSAACGETSFDDATAESPVLMLTGECLCGESVALTLMVTDGYDTTTCDAVVNVDDRRPPIVDARDTALAIWPPNHKYYTVDPSMMLMSAEDACGRTIDVMSAEVVEVTCDEPDNDNGIGDGNTRNDVVIDCPNTVRVRAERAGGGDGRVYTIVYRLTGQNDMSTDVTVHVVVPHDQGGRAAGDSGTAYTVTPSCGDDFRAAR